MAEEKQSVEETKTTVASESVAVPPKKKSNKTLWIVLGIVLVVFVLLPAILLTVGGIFLKDKLDDPNTSASLIEGIVEKSTGENIDINAEDGSFTAKSEDGDSTIGFGDQKLPEDFPKDLANYIPEKKVTFVITSKNENKQTWSVTTTVDKSYNDAVKYFEGAILTPDYTETSTFGFGNSTTFYGKKSGTSVSVTVSKADDENGDTTVSYILTEE
jgi:hypothetical protein